MNPLIPPIAVRDACGDRPQRSSRSILTAKRWLHRGTIALGLTLGLGSAALGAQMRGPDGLGLGHSSGLAPAVLTSPRLSLIHPIAQTPSAPNPEAEEAAGKPQSAMIPAQYWGAITLGAIALIFLIPLGVTIWANRPLPDLPDIDAKPRTPASPPHADRTSTPTHSYQFGLLRLALFAPPLPLPPPFNDFFLRTDSTPAALALPNPEALALGLLRLTPHWSHAKLSLQPCAAAEEVLQQIQRTLLKDKATIDLPPDLAAALAPGANSAESASGSPPSGSDSPSPAGYWVVTCVLSLQDIALDWSQPYEPEALATILEQLATLPPAQLPSLHAFVVPAAPRSGLSADELLVRYPDLVAF